LGDDQLESSLVEVGPDGPQADQVPLLQRPAAALHRCSGLTLAGYQVPTKPLCHSLFSREQEEEIQEEMKKLMG